MTVAPNRKRNVVIAVTAIIVLIISLTSVLYLINNSSPNSPLPRQFDYNLGVYPTNGTVQQVSSLVTNINVTYIQGSPQNVTLTASGGPDGTVYDFSKQTGTPFNSGGFTSNLTINVPAMASTDIYTVNVTSTAVNGKTYSNAYTLTVLNAEIQVSGTVVLNSRNDIVPSQIEFVNGNSTYTAAV
jgi:hypothetical protein